MTSSPACFAAFGVVLAREYQDRRYARSHRLTVDSYAVQHPGSPSPQSVQSVAVHLCRLCLILERSLPIEKANDAMLAVKRFEHRFRWLEPPPSVGEVTVKDVLDARSPEDHEGRVREWAECAWTAWSPHHATVRSWLPESLRFA